MDKFQNKYRIASARWQNWDYRNECAYFITICTKDRLCYFGNIANEEMHLSDIGKLAEKYWLEIPNHFKNVYLGEYVIMPNHIHGILIIKDPPRVETLHCNVSNNDNNIANKDDVNDKSLQCNDSNIDDDLNDKTLLYNDSNIDDDLNDKTLQCNVSTGQFMAHISPKSGSISTIIRSYKSVCTKNINLQHPESNFGWQTRFHDRVIRNEHEYKRIENYILTNPQNWNTDKFQNL